MKPGRSLLAPLAVGVAVLMQFSTPSCAAVFIATFTGTTSGTDGEGVFGQPGSVIQDSPFVAIFKYNITSFQALTLPQRLIAQGQPGPVLSASIKIDGSTFTLPTMFESSFVTAFQGAMAMDLATATAGSPLIFYSLNALIFNPTLPYSLSDLDAPLTVASSNALSQGDFHAVGSFGVTDLKLNDSVFALAAVPEPATWAMLVLGFGALGTMLRYTRDRRSSTA